MSGVPTQRHRPFSSHGSQANNPDQPGFSQLLTTALGSPFLTTPDLPDESELVDGAPIYVPYTQTITRPPSPTPTVDSTTFSFIYHDPDAPRTPFKAILPRIWHHISPGMRPMSFSFPPSPSPPPYSSRRKSNLRHPQDSPESVSFSDLEPLDGEEGELITIDDEACFFFDAFGARAVTGLDILALLPTELALHILIMLCTDDQDSSSSASLSSSRSSISPIIRQPYHALHDILICLEVSKTWRTLAADNTVWRALFLSRWPVDLALRRRSNNSSNAQNLHKLRGMAPPKVVPQPMPHAIPSYSMKNSLRLKIRRKQRKMTRNLADLGHSRLAPPQVTGFQPPPSTPAPVLDINPVSVQRTVSLHTIRKGPPSTQLVRNVPRAGGVREALERRCIFTSNIFAYHRPSEETIWRRPTISFCNTFGMSAPTLAGPLGLNVPAPSTSAPQMPSGFAHYPTQSPSEALSRLCNTYQVPFAPKVTSIAGHTDSVYCLQVDSKRIITGSRDRTIKIWSLKGRLLGSFGGTTTAADGTTQGHTGSVLCLKFSPDWDKDEDRAEHQLKSLSGGGAKKGFMVSGSSDCTICVWELCTERKLSGMEDGQDDGEREVSATVVATLKGHTGGVLDLRMDENWIVSCSKDASIRVWDRKTYELKRVLRGHEGPVNAVGLQNGRVVSASGDGKMILWDIDNGERIRTFEGHNRGLACIEFKDDLIVSGSNDCKIKVWSASTGACLCTLGGHEALVRALAFEPKTGRLVSASYDKTVKVWNLFTGKLVQEFKNIHTSHIFDVKFDVSRIVSTSHDQKIVVLDFSQGLDTTFFA